MTTVLQKRGTRWYARIRWYDNGRRSERMISLKTANEGVAVQHFVEVKEVASAIKNGVSIAFPWQNNNEPMKIIRYDLECAVSDYLKYLKTNGAKIATIQRAQCCFNNVMNVLGNNIPIANIKVDNIEVIKCYFNEKRSKVGINMILSRLRSLLYWCRDVKEIIASVPKIMLIKIPEKTPAYLTEADLSALLSLSWLDIHYKEAFKMYWETGMRLREAFHGKTDGDWFVISSSASKTGLYREIKLKEYHKNILLGLKRRLEISNASFRTATGHYSKVFKKAVKAIGRGELHFHNLRDTFAIMRYLETRDIYQVSKELGHTTVKVTEKYARFNIRRLAQDFPTLAKDYHENGRILYEMGGSQMGGRMKNDKHITERVMA